jgi:hypothetical protein
MKVFLYCFFCFFFSQQYNIKTKGEDGEEGESKESGHGKQSQEYDDYYMENEDYQVSACVEGTDCTDCGGIDAVVDYTKPLEPDSGLESCTNTCMYQRDGVCDDPRGTKYCEIGFFHLLIYYYFIFTLFILKLIPAETFLILADLLPQFV